jgi:hypothetical protein
MATMMMVVVTMMTVLEMTTRVVVTQEEEVMTKRSWIAGGQSGIDHPDVNNIRTRFEV